jgi:hypothetical protein
MARSESQTGDEVYEFGPFRVVAARERLLRNGEPDPSHAKELSDTFGSIASWE